MTSGKDQARTDHNAETEDRVDPSAQEAAEKAVEEALRQAGAEHLVEDEAPAEDGADAKTGDSNAAQPNAEDEITRLSAENAELKDRMMRVVADAENTKRRAEKDASDAKKYAASSFVKEMLPAVDNLRRALDSVPEALKAENETVNNLAVGVEMTEKQILDAFEKAGIKKVDPLGEKFSYDRHQAISEATDTGKPAGTVIQVLQPGYMLHDRLLRPAMVVVAKGEPKAGGDGGGVDTTA
ncbi:nucleotide exchange factor GrpE [Marivibrio halodurans]|uniref:Protein GrpE n=1 Tax=Marivibrio halodurans TaxID=2039722 RepID=A0A8J7V5L6_9PROT|nr:nucleotide exchange factor GrpE [Marivibrio halodurans]MBP5859099.1 nucleotide exchange factor GrpE [Marivibrio halodurans]